jgi:DNA-binding NarL/FixJ family response regulator
MSIPHYAGSARPDSTVLIIDDHDLVATSLAISLRSAGLRARQHAVRSRDSVIVAAAAVPPGVVLLDLDLGHDPNGALIDGTELIEGFCARGWRVLVLSGTSDETRIGKALAAGALAAISKSAGLPILVTAVRRAVQGVEVMHPARRQHYIDAHLRRQDQAGELDRRLASLSDRERAVLGRLAQGRRAKSIADEFSVSIATIRTQIRAVLTKLDVGSQLEAVSLLHEFRRSTRNTADPDNGV